jgi:hypothetical protein
MANIHELARRVIECDEAITQEEDEIRDLLEDVRSWGVDLARMLMTDEQEYKIRKAIREAGG